MTLTWVMNGPMGWTDGGSAERAMFVDFDGIYNPGVYGDTVVGGPHGELALLGTYYGLYDFTTASQSRQTLIQTFYP